MHGDETDIGLGRPASAEAILEELVDGVLELDRAWRITYLNPGAARILGRTREELLGRDFWESFPNLAATPFAAVYRQAMAARSIERFEGEYVVLRAWFEVRVFPARDGGIVIFFRDISDRVASERALGETRALLDAVMHFSRSLIYAKDPEGRFTFANRKLEELLGFAPGALLGKSDHDIFPAEIADKFRANDLTVMRERRALTAEEDILVDGQLRTNLSVKSPLERPDGTVFGIAGVSTDVTERVRHQQENALLAEVGLKLTETLDWDASLAAIVDAVATQFADCCLLNIIDEDGVMRRQTVGACEPSRLIELRQLEFPRDLPLGRALHEGKTERIADSDETWRDTIARSPAHRAVVDAVGARSMLLVPLIAHGRAIGLLEILSAHRRFDARDQETAEELGRLCALALDNRRATEQLRKESSLRELFMAVLAHDLRNPLSAIQIGATTLARREDLPDDALRGAQRIISSAQRMGKLIEQVLDLTRARAMGGIPVVRREVELAAVVEAVVEEVRAAHPARAIDVVVRGDARGSWDPDRLGQAVSNLVGNAVTHGTPDTPVRVELVGGEQVVLTVSNASAPIAPETLATLFDPFRRGEKSSRGLGLGLYITDQIVRAHGGSIAAESDESGTRFRVVLPR